MCRPISRLKQALSAHAPHFEQMFFCWLFRLLIQEKFQLTSIVVCQLQGDRRPALSRPKAPSKAEHVPFSISRRKYFFSQTHSQSNFSLSFKVIFHFYLVIVLLAFKKKINLSSSSFPLQTLKKQTWNKNRLLPPRPWFPGFLVAFEIKNVAVIIRIAAPDFSRMSTDNRPPTADSWQLDGNLKEIIDRIVYFPRKGKANKLPKKGNCFNCRV